MRGFTSEKKPTACERCSRVIFLDQSMEGLEGFTVLVAGMKGPAG